MINSPDIKVKNSIVLARMLDHPYHYMLIEISSWVAAEFGLFITDAWRKMRHENDVHGTIPGRALDLRTRIYPDAQIVCDAINARWIYDPCRPEMQCCKIHDSGEGSHIHLQVHPKTRRR